MEDRFGLYLEGERSNDPSWIKFGLAAIPGLFLYLAGFLVTVMGECLPRDGSFAMLRCDATAYWEIWLYLPIAALHVGAAVRLQLRHSHLGWFVMLFGAFSALILSSMMARGLAAIIV